MTVKIMLDEGAYMPTRAHKTDAGMDLYARIEAQKDFAERLKEAYTLHEGLHIEIDNIVKEKTEEK